MSKLSKVILLYGDPYVCKKNIASAKRKYEHVEWTSLSATDCSLDELRMEIEMPTWDGSPSMLMIYDVPNRKAVRDFLIEVASNIAEHKHLAIWDSNYHIKPGNKTWAEFTKSIEKLPSVKILNAGVKIESKKDAVEHVLISFERKERTISYNNARLFVNLVGIGRELLDTEIEKICLVAPTVISDTLIWEMVFPSSTNPPLYELGNAINSGSYPKGVQVLQSFLNQGVNENVIAEILLKRARWHLAILAIYRRGYDWNKIPNKLMDMGRFPMSIWQNENLPKDKKTANSEPFQIIGNAVKYMKGNQGVPAKYIKPFEKGKDKIKSGERIPLPFMAEEMVDFVHYNVFKKNVDKYALHRLKEKMLDKMIDTYLEVFESYCKVRAGKNTDQDLNNMLLAVMHCQID